MHIIQKSILSVIRGYKLVLSPLLPAACRFWPTCSDYSFQAISKYGVCRGTWKAIKRLLKCHPFHEGGYDPLT